MNFDKVIQMLSVPENERPGAVMGFDGYIDTVSRLALDSRSAFTTMDSLGEFLIGRQERSCSLALDRRFRRFGGNMPICANALATLGIPVDCIGALGQGKPSSVFADMHARCTLHPVVEPGESICLEFSESKLFLADHGGAEDMSWESITDRIGGSTIRSIFSGAALIGLFNWGELSNMHGIWESLLHTVISELSGTGRWFLFDLSDCSGRSETELRAVLQLLTGYRAHGRVVLSVNDNELMSLASAAGFQGADPLKAGRVLSALRFAEVLVHHGRNHACVFTEESEQVIEGTRVDAPSVITGGGDHFNAGYALGLLAGLEPPACADLGNQVSHAYVKHGSSPEFEYLIRKEQP